MSNLLTLGVADAIRSSLGPKGMDKMIQTEKTTIITNDGATILKHMAVLHPAARMVPFSFVLKSSYLFCSWLIFLLLKMLKQAMGLLQW
jgi:TCP-1/cpn60 chaperonin family